MSLRRRMLLFFSVVVVVGIGMVAWLVSLRTRAVFEQVDQQRSNALVAQFRGQFARESSDIAQTLQHISSSERIQRIAYEATHGGDVSLYVGDAGSLAQEFHIDVLDIVTSDGTIVSSASWPARFGYHEQIPTISAGTASLHRQEVQDGYILAVAAVQQVESGEGSIYLIGGRKVDASFLQAFSVPTGSYVWLYRFNQPQYTNEDLLGENPVALDVLRPVLDSARAQQESSGILQLSSEKFDRVTVQAIPLKDDSGEVAAALLVGTSRAPLLQLQKHIRTIAFGIAGFGILISIGATLWIAAAFSRPIEKLAKASQQVALGEWNAQVEVSSSDELGQLAESFNAMTQQLVEQRGKLVQAERVAAWRELARRLAHELKNPLFPLQITVENLVRAQHLPPEEFNEIFQESTATLLAELGNLKTIIGRFSDFSKMPKPQLQATSLNELVTRVANLHEAQLKEAPKPISINLALAEGLPRLELDPDLIYRVISNLVLNAVDAMPEGGTISIETSADSDSAKLVVSDSGTGLTKEECERLFTPYYTTKQHGTGLGLAIVQSVISDHHGSITVQSEPGRGTSFVITLPRTQPGSAVQKADGAMA